MKIYHETPILIKPSCVRTWQRNQTDRCTPDLHITDTQPRITQRLITHYIRFTCNSAGTEELPDDDTYVWKHVGAAE
jgi:hypothetical protein